MLALDSPQCRLTYTEFMYVPSREHHMFCPLFSQGGRLTQRMMNGMWDSPGVRLAPLPAERFEPRSGRLLIDDMYLRTHWKSL